MRRLVNRRKALAAVLVPAAIAAQACKRAKKSQLETVEQSATLLSVVQMTDPAASAQLIRGFYPPEASAWRWTMQNFSVALKPPPGAAEKGAKLNFKFNLQKAGDGDSERHHQRFEAAAGNVFDTRQLHLFP
jgi:hypothetical protein